MKQGMMRRRGKDGEVAIRVRRKRNGEVVRDKHEHGKEGRKNRKEEERRRR